MANVPVFSTGVLAFSNAAVSYAPLCDCALTSSTTQATGNVVYQSAGILSLLRIRVTANTTSTTSSTIASAIAGSPGSMSISVAHGATGEFTDTLHTDSVSAGNTVGISVTVNEATNTITISQIYALFAATSNTVKRVGCYVAAGVTVSSASATAFYPFGGVLGAVTESKIQATLYITGTLTNLSIYVGTNGRGTASTARTRIGTANGQLAASITANTTGTFSDLTAHSDVLSSAGTAAIDFSVATSTGAGNLTFFTISVDVTTTDSTTVLATGISSTSQNANLTKYTYVAGSGATSGTQLNQEVRWQTNLTLSHLSVNVNTNTVTLASTFGLSGGTSAASITASTTGVFTDLSGSDFCASITNENFYMTTGATGTSMNWCLTTAKLAIILSTANGTNLLMLMGAGN
jgi:hypothetical protein